ncbi:MAG: phage holin family protein [Candidatus Roizmanbacteria bacterium]|nr:phage holin family protein [Candidatus Roizmanbacteria bacterium]
MKKIFRMVIFSLVAIFLTSLWNKGFIIKADPMIYLKAALIIAAVCYLIVPVSKLILLPLNILTLGFVSVIFYAAIFYFLLNRFQLISIKEWVFPGMKLFGITLTEMKISGLSNIFISSFSISTIINLLETII